MNSFETKLNLIKFKLKFNFKAMFRERFFIKYFKQYFMLPNNSSVRL